MNLKNLSDDEKDFDVDHPNRGLEDMSDDETDIYNQERTL